MNIKSVFRAICKVVVISFLIVLLLYFTCYNIKNNSSFLDASAVDIVTIIIAIVISYFFVQRKDDRRKQKDILVDLILKLRLQIENEKSYDFTGQSKDEITMRNRDLSNKIHIIEKMQDSFFSEADIKFINEKFDEYQQFIGDHVNNLGYLCESQKELKRPLELINDRLIEMTISLYK